MTGVFLCAAYALDIGVHTGGTGLPHLRGNVGINIQCKGRCSVSQRLLDRLNIIPGANGRHGVRMAQIVKRNPKAEL